jgi:D-3-phosphoglycerate dehydrogenase / 2-oxoglutarate reductase
MKVFVSTIPFASNNKLPLELMNDNKITYEINPFGRKITKEELAGIIPDFDGLIAGTEQIDESVLARAKNLKIISRVGIGLDGLDLNLMDKMGIVCTYTPDAPAPAVTELTLAYMLMLARDVGISNREMQRGVWERHFGFRLSEMTIGIIGAGRIGGRVIRRLSAFGSPELLVNDLQSNKKVTENLKLNWTSKEEIYERSDMISIHVPLTAATQNLISNKELISMKNGVKIINTARGGIVNELDLALALKSGKVQSAALDVFQNEPYSGELSKLENCFLSAHMGSMSHDCRSLMEIEATQEIINFKKNASFNNLVPRYEYDLQRNFKK